MARLAKGTLHWVLAPLALGALLLVASALPAAPFTALRVLAVLSLLSALFLANFFRDPERLLAEGLVSPADGVVTVVRPLPPGGTEVQIFMNVHNVHVNRAPCDARVLRREHRLGAHVPAWHKDSARNERVTWDLETPHGPVRVVQVAGLLARRIVPYAEEGQRLAKGERIGIIRLGSRVDVHLPPGVAPRVAVGDRVLAGSTTLGDLRKTL